MIHDIPRTLILTVHKSWNRFEITRGHLAEHGIKSEAFIGLDRTICKLDPVMTFDINAQGEKLGRGPLVTYLTHYMAWMVMQYLPEEVFWVLEDDARLTDNWRFDYSLAMESLPSDWEMVFLGSCCTGNQERRYVGQNLYEVRYPLCGHAIMYHKRVLPKLLRIHQKIWAPLDIALKFDSLPHIRAYTILPRICDQRWSYIGE